MENCILIKRISDIVLLILNRPEKRNALSPQIVNELTRQIDDIAGDKSVKALIITGAGKAFCAGADLAYLQKLSKYSDKDNMQDSQSLADLFHKLYRLPKLTIAMVNGPALAGGCGLALCCDYIFAGQENASFGFTEVRIGFIPAIVMNFIIRKVPLQLANHLALSGGILSAEEAKTMGLVYELFPAAELEKQTVGFVANLLEQNSFTAMMQTKNLFQNLLDLPLNSGLELAGRTNAQSRKTADCQKGLKAFLNKQKINWR